LKLPEINRPFKTGSAHSIIGNASADNHIAYRRF